MKLVLMADTHLQSVTREFRKICDRYCSDADLVIHLGDWTREAILNFMGTYHLEGVAGNMDGPEISDRLPRKRVLQIGRFQVGITHGCGSSENLRPRLQREFEGVDAICFGHTHQPLAEEKHGVFWFNPGSVFLGRSTHPKTLGILYLEDRIRSEFVNL